MCGIAGFVRHGNTDINALNIALVVMAHHMDERGDQSFGWTNGTEVKKFVGSITRNFGPDVRTNDDVQVIHTRWSTHGKINEHNQHPFQMGDVLGMHNGVIYNHEELNRDTKRRFAVDSMHIFAHIAEGRKLDELEGYGTVVFWHKGDNRTYIGTFNGGELSVAKLKDGTILWASTPEAVEAALGMSGLKSELEFFYKTIDGQLYNIEGGQLWHINDSLTVEEVWGGMKWSDYNKSKLKPVGNIKGDTLNGGKFDFLATHNGRIDEYDDTPSGLRKWGTYGDDKLRRLEMMYDDTQGPLGMDEVPSEDESDYLTAMDVDPRHGMVECLWCDTVMEGTEQVVDIGDEMYSCVKCSRVMI